MILENLNIDIILAKYKDGVENILKTKDIKVLSGQIFEISDDFSIKKEHNLNNFDLKKCLKEGGKIYLPFVSAFESYVKCVNGSQFDLDEGLEADWIEGIGYVDSGMRFIDVGNFTISKNNLVGFMIEKKKCGYEVLIGEYILGSTKIEKIKNTGLLGIEINNFLNCQ